MTQAAAEGSAPKVKRVRNFRCHAKNQISGAFSEIVHTLIEEAKSGSVNHTKLLFDIGGVKDHPKHKQKDEAGVSFAEILRRELSPEHASEQVRPATQETEHTPSAVTCISEGLSKSL